MRERWIQLIIALSLSVCLWHLMLPYATTRSGCVQAWLSCRAPDYRTALGPEWRARVLANAVANRYFPHEMQISISRFQHGVGIYCAGWFGVTCLCLCMFWHRPVWMMFAVFACLQYAYTPNGLRTVLPWDYPALFFWTVLVTCAMRRWRWSLLVCVAAGVGFKETVLLGALVPLFWPGSWRHRIAWACAIGAAGTGVKVLLDAYVSHSPYFFSQTIGGSELRIVTNIKWLCGSVAHVTGDSVILRQYRWNHLAFVNGGTLLAVWLVRGRWMLKTLIATLAIGILICGEANEFRIWFEAIPVALAALAGMDRS